jgi:hypothetical protein
MLVADEAEMARAISQVGSIDPRRCRTSVAERYDISVTAAGYEQVYRRTIAAGRARGIHAAHPGPASTGLSTGAVGMHWRGSLGSCGAREAAISTAGASGVSRVEIGMPLAG